MAIRFLLVTLVTALGCEPPTSSDLASWAKTGREWVLARIDDVRGAGGAADRDRADVAFDGVVASMADDFSTDLAALDRPKVEARIAFEPIVVPDDLAGGVAFALNQDAQGVGLVVPIAIAPVELAEPPARANRLASAVRLTRQAALAWMTVLRETETTVVRR